MQAQEQSIAAERYFARKGARLSNHDAREFGPILKRLAEENRSDAAHILKEAKDPTSPLHRHFVWDDTEAAYQYRLDQARHLANSIQIEVVEDDNLPPQRVRAFLPITINTVAPDNPSARPKPDANSAVHYKPIEWVRETPSAAEQVLRRFEKELRALYKRNEALLTMPEFGSSKYKPILDHIRDVVEEEIEVEAEV